MTKTYKVMEYHLIPAKIEKGEKPYPVTEYHVISAGLTWEKAKELCKINRQYTIVPEHAEGNLEKGKENVI